MADPISISIYNQKGGIGKTTGMYNMAVVLSERYGIKVLMVDADAQASLTSLVYAEQWQDADLQQEFYEDCDRKQQQAQPCYVNMANIFHETVRQHNPGVTQPAIAEHIQLTQVHNYENLFIIPGSLKVGQLEQPTGLGIGGLGFYTAVPGSYHNVINAFARKHGIQLVLWDLNPSVGPFNQAIVMGSDYLAMPFLPDFLSCQGMRNILSPDGIIHWAEQFARIGHTNVPRLLGCFPQRALSRGKDQANQPKTVQAFQKWVVTAFDNLKNKSIPALNNSPYDFLVPDFKLEEFPGIPEYYSLGPDAQAAGRPLSDLTYPHRHYTGQAEESRALNKGEKTRKQKIHAAFRQLVARLFSNMTEAHKQALGDAFLKQISVDGVLDTGVAQLQLAVSQDTSCESAEAAFYTDDHVGHLLEHYLAQHDDSIPLTAMQGDDLFAARGQLQQNIVDRVTLQRNGHIGNKGYYCPLNLGQGHWVLLVVESNPSDQPATLTYHYWDPLGHDMSALMETRLKATATQLGIAEPTFRPYLNRQQRDGFNCGPWVVEFARALAASADPTAPSHQFPPANINTCREEHEDALQQLGVQPPGAPSAQRKSKRRKLTQQGGATASGSSRTLFGGARQQHQGGGAAPRARSQPSST